MIRVMNPTWRICVSSMKILSAEYRSLTGRIERLTKELYALEGIRHDVERLMKLCHVQENLTTETLDEQDRIEAQI